MCGKSLLGLPDAPDLPEPPPIEEEVEPAVFEEAGQSKKKRGRASLKRDDDLQSGANTGLAIPEG